MDRPQNRISSKMFEVSFAANSTASPEGIIEEVNRSFLRVWGYASKEEVIGKPIAHFILHPEETAAILKSLNETEAWEGEYTARRKDGSTFPARGVATAVRDESGAIIGYESSILDVTEQKKTEETLRKNESTYRGLLNSIRQAIYVLDRSGRFIDVNDGALAMYGFTRDELTGKSPADVSAEGKNDMAGVVRQLERAFNGEPQQMEFWGRRKNGEIFPKEIHLYKGTYFGQDVVIAVADDITDRIRSNEVLRERQANLVALLENTEDSIWAVDREYRIMTVNSNFRRNFLIAFDKELKPGTDILKAIPAALHTIWKDRYDRALAGDHFMVQDEFQVEGVPACVEISFNPIEVDGEVMGASCFSRDIADRKRTEEALRDSEARYRNFFEDDLTADFIASTEGYVLASNPAFVRIFGFASVDEVKELDVAQLYPRPEVWVELQQRLRMFKKLEYVELEMRRRDGKQIFLVANIFGIFDDMHRLVQVKSYLFDDTRRRELEKQLIQAQKMESLGTLAGGIAHDFNNILSIILGHSQLMRTKGERDESKVARSLEAILQAASRGASLVKQLLTFARKSESVLESVRVNDIAGEIENLLGETLPKSITIATSLDPNLPSVVADATQIHQVILNLCVNARDAMPKGGQLTIATKQVEGIQVRMRFPTAVEKEYVEIRITDNGIGMDEQTRLRVFDPFFTTKGPGKGSGLGLAVVFGIVESHRGFIDVQSSPGLGTIFSVYLPVPEKQTDAVATQAGTLDQIPGGKETILFVEDEEMIREMVVSVLESKGYKILTASDGIEAWEMYQKGNKHIHLVLTDIGLPHLSGDDMLVKIMELRPDAKVILASGFVESDLRTNLLQAGALQFVQKPYAIDELLRAVRAGLDKKKERPKS